MRQICARPDHDGDRSNDALNAATRCAWRQRRGTAAQPFAVNRDMPGRLTALNPGAQDPFQAGDVEVLEQFTPYRWCRNPAAADPDAGQGFPAQPFAPPYDTQLVPAAGKERRHSDQQQRRQRITLALRASMIRD